MARFPRRLDANLGPQGKRLSGGQRVGIARALYRSPSTLIFDEATAALDNITAAAVAEAIRAPSGQVTVIVVAHRLATVRDCDRILFLERGEMVGLGTFDDLLATCPPFADLVRAGSLSADRASRDPVGEEHPLDPDEAATR